MNKIFKNEPKYRIKQAKLALFNNDFKSWNDAFELPKNLREKLSKEMPWNSLEESDLKISKDGSKKALLKCKDGSLIESVLMENSRGSWTICVSSQVGCAMGCVFCQTGNMGLKRNLEEEEIIDQYRYWAGKGERIGNIVFMGMGEPLLNYENVRGAISELLEYSGIGRNHIVVSTVGIIEKLNYLLTDELWPDVKLAVSLHSANDETRKKLVPSHVDNFMKLIEEWALKYLNKKTSRTHFLFIEYILAGEVNDSESEVRELVSFLNKIRRVKVNLILLNKTSDPKLKPSSFFDAEKFQNIVKRAGFVCVIRRSYGSDIDAACGQLAAKIE